MRVGTNTEESGPGGNWRNLAGCERAPAAADGATSLRPAQPPQPRLISGDNPTLLQELQYPRDPLLRRSGPRINRQFRRDRSFVGVVHARETQAFPGGHRRACLLVKTLGIALLAHVN